MERSKNSVRDWVLRIFKVSPKGGLSQIGSDENSAIENTVQGDVSGAAVQANVIAGPVMFFRAGEGSSIDNSEPSVLVSNANLYQVGVHRSLGGNGAVVTYVERDIDANLRAQTTKAGIGGGFVLVVGGSASGKTRAAWQAVVTQFPNHSLIIPEVGSDLPSLTRRVKVEASRSSGVVVWLDDIDRHINTNSSLDVAMIYSLVEMGVVVIATLRQVIYDEYRSVSSRTRGIRDLVQMQSGQGIIRSVDPVYLDRVWSEAEITRATQTANRYGDQALSDALEGQRRSAENGTFVHGVAEYLAAAPELIDLWKCSKNSIGTEGGHPRGYRLVAAAVDLARIGVEHVTSELLEVAHARYELPSALRPEPFSDALEWASEVVFGASSLLVPSNDMGHPSWRPFDYLIDVVSDPIPPAVWGDALLHIKNPDVLFSMGIKAADDPAPFLVEGELASFFESGDHISLFVELAWNLAATRGHEKAITALGFLYRESGDLVKAKSFFERAARKEIIAGMLGLGLLLDGQGEADEAFYWWSKAASRGDVSSMVQLGLKVEAKGDLEKAEFWYKKADGLGSLDAIVALGALFYKRGEIDKSKAYWKRAAEKGDDAAMEIIKLLHEE
ncbi:hypothetical protein SUDANB121_05816 [Nocardiopsis dassonvillei]|uniref:tetratricopeptide repeat protein n=1 Tax=Nocardiopsis dassonvillei TaxID=2014 RepID=UPI003F56DF43